MVRGNGSARAETHVKATTRPKTMRITMPRGPHRHTLKNVLSTITISAFSFGSRCAAEWDARKLAIRLSGPFPDSQSWHAPRMAFGADTPHRWLQLLLPAPALHQRLS